MPQFKADQPYANTDLQISVAEPRYSSPRYAVLSEHWQAFGNTFIMTGGKVTMPAIGEAPHETFLIKYLAQNLQFKDYPASFYCSAANILQARQVCILLIPHFLKVSGKYST